MSRHIIMGVIMTILISLTIALAAVAPPTTITSIQYDVNMMQIGILFNTNRLYTFEPKAPLTTFFNNNDIKHVLSTYGTCEMYDHHTKTIVSSTTTLFDVFVHTDSILQCINEQGQITKFELTPIIDPAINYTEETIQRIRAEYLSNQISKDNELKPFPATNHDLVSMSLDTVIGWAIQFIQYHWGPLHPFPSFPTDEKTLQAGNVDVGLYHFNGQPLTHAQSQKLALQSSLPHKDKDHTFLSSFPQAETSVFAVTADWGSGTMESSLVSKLMVKNKPQYTVNMGDLYLVGSPEDARKHALGIRLDSDPFKEAVSWLPGELGSFWFQGNHEMYSRGYGYFDSILPAMGFIDPTTKKTKGQPASYQLMENEHWRIIFLDTGYTTYSQLIHNDDNRFVQEIIDWLTKVVKLDNQNDHRGVIILTHHNFVSAFNKGQSLGPANQLKELLKDRVVLTLWGHEHKTAIYEPSNLGGVTAFPRCIGTGGFAVDHIDVPPTTRESGLIAFDNRPYSIVTGDIGNKTIGFNGYFNMKFTGEYLDIEYYTLQWKNNDKKELDSENGHLTMVERFTYNSDNGNIVQVAFDIIDKDITYINNVERDEILMEDKQVENKHNVHKIRHKLIEKQTTLEELEERGLDMDTYYHNNKNKRYTKHFGQKVKYSEDGAKAALKQYILDTIDDMPLTNDLASGLELNNIVGIVHNAVNMKNAMKPRKFTSKDIKHVTIDHDTIVDVDGHKFPHIQF